MVEKQMTFASASGTGALERSRSRYKGHRGKMPNSDCEPQPQLGNAEVSKQRTSRGERTQPRELVGPRSVDVPDLLKTQKPSIARSTKSSQASQTSREGDKTKDAKAAAEDRPLEVIPARPTFDAPISAVNAGERRVSVRHAQSLISIPISPATTPYDIVCAAKVQLSQDIGPGDHVLLESYTPLGLERPLRKYEHVRDLLNSWDSDAQNTLVLVPSFFESIDVNLNLAGVPKQPPEDASVQMYHSQRPGQWDKKWINLRADGQISVAKHGVSTNICHLSDFDIYMPTKTRLSKYIRPPNKFCFAIKSQQKSSIFLSTQNFVHLFSTNDKTLATHFYSSVQIWRSWYLVHVMGQRAENSSLNSSSTRANRCIPEQTQPIARQVRQTQGLAEPGECRARVDHHQDELAWASPIPTGGDWAPHCRSHDLVTAAATDPKTYPSTSCKAPPLRQTSAEPFAATGLLGQAYTQRKAAQRERENPHVVQQDQVSLGRAANGNRLTQATTQLITRLEPLIDRLSDHQEAPENQQGRRLVSESAPAHGLIKAATSHHQGLRLPLDLQSLEQREANQRPHPFRDANRESHQKASLSAWKSSNSESDGKKIFSTGLLANIERSRGQLGQGTGARDRDYHVHGRMISLEEGPQYAPGSLLASVQQYQGIKPVPVIAREKRNEIDIAVGEAK